MLQEKFDGVVPENRKDLESLSGVGEHAASVILARAFGHTSEFAVDLHVRRIAKRMGLVGAKATDREIIKWGEQSVNPAHLSRSFVEFGQKICRYHPSCKKCTFQATCPKKKWIK
jgi:endonuclease-3